jgi:hypothetical protein
MLRIKKTLKPRNFNNFDEEMLSNSFKSSQGDPMNIFNKTITKNLREI